MAGTLNSRKSCITIGRVFAALRRDLAALRLTAAMPASGDGCVQALRRGRLAGRRNFAKAKTEKNTPFLLQPSRFSWNWRLWRGKLIASQPGECRGKPA